MSVVGVIRSLFPLRGSKTFEKFWTRWSGQQARARPKTELRSGGRFLLARFHPRRITPKCLKVVSLAHVCSHDMHYDVEVIQYNPCGMQSSIHCLRPKAMLIAKLVCDLIHDGAQMWFARSGCHNKIVCDG